MIHEKYVEWANNSVERGAKLLDKKQPDWFKRIDLDRLELKENKHCVLGQIADSIGSEKGYTQIFDYDFIVHVDEYCHGPERMREWASNLGVNADNAYWYGFNLPMFDCERQRIGVPMDDEFDSKKSNSLWTMLDENWAKLIENRQYREKNHHG